jgi:hypothetical protein
MTRLNRAAVHEAGHAVIGRVLMQRCGPATIKPNKAEGEAGHGIIADPYATLGDWDEVGRWRGNSEDSVMRGRIITFMAGRAAEEKMIGECAGGDDDDQVQIYSMLGSIVPADADDADIARVHNRLLSWTRTLVARHRHKIEGVAALLMKHKILQPNQIDAAIAGAPPPGAAG